MSRDASLSPKSAEIRFGYGGNTSNEPINVEVLDEEQNSSLSQLGFSTTMSTSFIVPEELVDSVDDLTVTKDKKKQRASKSGEDISRKRKDTTNSITNFFHRFTRGDREEKKVIEEEEEEPIERPEKLISPDSEEKWFESRSLSGRIIGHEGDADMYEWSPTELTETLVRETQPVETNQAIFEEKGMLKLLEDFRNGELRWLDLPQIKAMGRVKDAHEDVSNIHLKVYEIESANRKKKKHERAARSDFQFSDSDDSEDERRIEKLFEDMNARMVSMHSSLDTVPFYDSQIQNQISSRPVDTEEEYFSS